MGITVRALPALRILVWLSEAGRLAVRCRGPRWVWGHWRWACRWPPGWRPGIRSRVCSWRAPGGSGPRKLRPGRRSGGHPPWDQDMTNMNDGRHPAGPERAREERARENREYVRRTLAEKQPEFAALLESIEAELACPLCRHADGDRVSGLRRTGEPPAFGGARSRFPAG